MKKIDGGVIAPIGFQANGMHVGLKKQKKDLSLIYSEKPCMYAGTFTTNVVKAAPVLWNMERLEKANDIHAVLVNSGNANACTGEKGILDNAMMAMTTADMLGIQTESVVVASTGVIGVPLPIDTVTAGIQMLAPTIGNTIEQGDNAATGILTTDTYTKQIAIQIEIDDTKVTIGAMGKGSGMIHPNMATMLSFVTTDANITKELFEEAVKGDVDDTYNMISVDGDTSTNDMVIALANGAADNTLIDSKNEDYMKFKEALHIVNQYISRQIISDGEGVTKVIEVHVNGAKDNNDAKLIGKSVITSNLVKTAFFGEDANWGRILCAMGYSGAEFNPQKVSLAYKSSVGEIELLHNGLPVSFDEDEALKLLKEKDIEVKIKLEEGSGQAIALGCDLSYDYVKINGEYRS